MSALTTPRLRGGFAAAAALFACILMSTLARRPTAPAHADAHQALETARQSLEAQQVALLAELEARAAQLEQIDAQRRVALETARDEVSAERARSKREVQEYHQALQAAATMGSDATKMMRTAPTSEMSWPDS